MLIEGTFTFPRSGQASVTLEKPDKCPICHKGVDPSHEQGLLTAKDIGKVQAVFKCHYHDCLSFFIAYYERKTQSGTQRKHTGYEYRLKKTAPITPQSVEFHSSVSETSPDFCAIFNQAKEAEDQGLDKICGVGYRKALEFLIKDYAISMNPDKEQEIKK